MEPFFCRASRPICSQGDSVCFRTAPNKPLVTSVSLRSHAGRPWGSGPPRQRGVTKFARGLVLIDPPYEAQLEEFDHALSALRDALARWPQGTFALWYPIKLRRSLGSFYRRAATLPAKSVLVMELLVRPDDSPLRMNGSGLLVLNAPWRFDATLQPTLRVLRKALGETGAADARMEWLKAAD